MNSLSVIDYLIGGIQQLAKWIVSARHNYMAFLAERHRL